MSPSAEPSEYRWSPDQIKAVARLRAKGELDPEQGTEEGVLNAAAAQLRTAFVAEARVHGVEVSPMDVAVEWSSEAPDQGETDEQEDLDVRYCRAQWWPQNRPVRFDDGPEAGRVMTAPHHPLRPGVIRMAYPEPQPEEDQVEGTPVPLRFVDYRLAGWDERQRQWVFSTEGGGPVDRDL